MSINSSITFHGLLPKKSLKFTSKKNMKNNLHIKHPHNTLTDGYWLLQNKIPQLFILKQPDKRILD